MGHRDFKTTLIYADYAPVAHEAEMAERAFRQPQQGPGGETHVAITGAPEPPMPRDSGRVDDSLD